jgi:O-antigen/teichoic acid export membrane protein
MNARTRLRRVFALGTLGNALSLISNLILPPLLLSQFGAEKFAEWIYLFSIPLSLAALDLGVSAAFSTDVFSRYVSGNKSSAQAYFKTGLKITIILGIITYLLASLIISAQATESRQTVLYILSAYIIIGYPSELLSASFKIAEKFQHFQILGITFRALEVVAVASASLTGNLVLTATSLLILRAGQISAGLLLARNYVPELFRGDWSRWERFSHLIRPSLTYSLGPLVMLVSLQAPIYILSSYSTANAIIAFTTVRTMARIPLQISSQISFSLFTEYTRIRQQEGNHEAARLYRKGKNLIAVAILAFLPLGILFGGSLYALWMRQSVDSFELIFACLLAESLLEALIRNRIYYTSAENKHTADTVKHLLISAATAAIFYLCTKKGLTLEISLLFTALFSIVLSLSIFRDRGAL